MPRAGQAASLTVILAVFCAARTTGDELHRQRFLFLTAADASRQQLLDCPNHRFGGMNDGVREIKRRAAAQPPGSISFVQFCTSGQLRTIKQCADLVDVAAINPFVRTSQNPPDDDTLLWPGFDHPIVNRIRDLRSAAGENRLIARLDLQGYGHGEGRFFEGRGPIFDEIHWLVYATIGSDFKGIVWLYWPSDPTLGGRIKHLETSLKRYRDDLGAARPVAWAAGPDGQPVSALRSGKVLFVVLLNPSYMQIDDRTQVAKLPVDPQLCEGVVECRLPADLQVVEGTTLSGIPVELDADGALVKAAYSFRSGGEILVLRLAGETTTETDGAQPALPPDETGAP